MLQKHFYWAEQVEIQRRSASAWLAQAEGRKGDAVSEMRAAADREDATEKNSVTPGPLAPARELLAYMLLDNGEPALALKEFEATMKKEPNHPMELTESRAGARVSVAHLGRYAVPVPCSRTTASYRSMTWRTNWRFSL